MGFLQARVGVGGEGNALLRLGSPGISTETVDPSPSPGHVWSLSLRPPLLPKSSCAYGASILASTTYSPLPALKLGNLRGLPSPSLPREILPSQHFLSMAPLCPGPATDFAGSPGAAPTGPLSGMINSWLGGTPWLGLWGRLSPAIWATGGKGLLLLMSHRLEFVPLTKS